MGFALSSMQLTSPLFPANGAIPEACAYDKGNTSPALSWVNVPEGTQSFALICSDPDAPLFANGAYGFVHWVLYNLPASLKGLEENTTLGTQGINNFGESGWGGPKPPENHGEHHYFFWLLALDKDLALEPGLTMAELLTKVEPHLLGANRLTGRFQR